MNDKYKFVNNICSISLHATTESDIVTRLSCDRYLKIQLKVFERINTKMALNCFLYFCVVTHQSEKTVSRTASKIRLILQPDAEGGELCCSVTVYWKGHIFNLWPWPVNVFSCSIFLIGWGGLCQAKRHAWMTDYFGLIQEKVRISNGIE